MLPKNLLIAILVAACFRSSDEVTVVECSNDDEFLEALNKYEVGIIPILATCPSVQPSINNSIRSYFSTGRYVDNILTIIQLNFDNTRQLAHTRNYLTNKLNVQILIFPTVLMTRNGSLVNGNVLHFHSEKFDLLYDTAFNPNSIYPTTIANDIKREKDQAFFNKKTAELIKRTQRVNPGIRIDGNQQESSEEVNIIPCDSDVDFLKALKENEGIIPILITTDKIPQDTDNSITNHFSTGQYKGKIKTIFQLNFSTKQFQHTGKYLKSKFNITRMEFPTVLMTRDGHMVMRKVTKHKSELYDPLYNDASNPQLIYPTTIANEIEESRKQKNPKLYGEKQADTNERASTGIRIGGIQQANQKRPVTDISDDSEDDDDDGPNLELELYSGGGSSGKRRFT